MLLPMIMGREFASSDAIQQLLAMVPENSAAKTVIGSAAELIFLQAQGDVRTLEIPMSYAVTRADPRNMASEAELMVARHGFKTLKIKGGQGFATDVEVVHAIRQAVGAGVALTVDANAAYEADELEPYVDTMANAGAVVVEDPVTLVPSSRFRTVVAAARVPVMADFMCASAWHAQAFLESGANALSVKPGRCGLLEANRIASLTAAAGAQACIGLFGESALGTLVSLQAARTHPVLTQFLPAELSFYLMLEAQVLQQVPRVQAGVLCLPPPAEIAGLIDPGLLNRHAI